MRCRACNGMMEVRPSRHGGFEDLCSHCRGWVYSSTIDDDYLRAQNSDSLDLSGSTSPISQYIEVEEELDSDDWQSNMERLMDRNHETPDLFDTYEE